MGIITVRKFNRKALDKLCEKRGFNSYAKAVKWLIDSDETRDKETEKLRGQVLALQDELNEVTEPVKNFGALIQQLVITKNT